MGMIRVTALIVRKRRQKAMLILLLNPLIEMFYNNKLVNLHLF